MNLEQRLVVPLKVSVEWDQEAEVYVATSADVPGLVAEAASLDILVSKVNALIPELIELNGSPAVVRALADQGAERLPYEMVTKGLVAQHA